MKNLKFSWEKLFILSILLPAPIVLVSIFSGGMPFWFDPARDFLSAIANQQKITLIGQPTGIPGLFYGPYWVWMLSLALFISKDPRVVQLLVLGIPYLIVFPLVLYKFKKILGLSVVLPLWFLFIFAFMRYAIFPWNPHLAPLFVLITFYFLIVKDEKKNNLLPVFLAGFFSGLIGNFHISFDIGLVLGIIVYFFASYLQNISFKNTKKIILDLFMFFLGFALTFMPFFLFEVRHGFLQIKTVLATILSPYPVVGLKGLSPDLIINSFMAVPSRLFELPTVYAGPVFAALIFLLALIFIKKDKNTKDEKNILLLSISVLFSVIFIFLTSKNPVWEYHFIALEIPFLFLIGLVIKKLSFVKAAIFICVIALGVINYYNFFMQPKASVLSYDSLAKREYVVNIIKNDARGENYTVFAYNPAIYTYDYTYLFNWLARKEVPFDPSQIERGGKLVYLIIQKTDTGIYQDYINSHAPSEQYITSKIWKVADGTTILRQELKSK